MSKDLWDLAERATKIVKEQIKTDINEDEMTGIFYQEFCEPTVAEKQHNIKMEWMLHNGFKKSYCGERKEDILSYKDEYSWTYEEILFESLKNIKAYKQWYDGGITENELDKLLGLLV